MPTAEGAIKLAIENTDCTLWKSRVLVIGNGRVGKILAERLKALGAYVTVSARKPADFGLLSALGFDYINTEHLNLKPIDYNIVFNTVDAKVIDDKSFNEGAWKGVVKYAEENKRNDSIKNRAEKFKTTL